MLYLSRGCKKSVMQKEKVVYVFYGPRESFWQSIIESVGMGIEEALCLREEQLMPYLS